MRIQVDGVNWILSQYNSGAGGILGDEMGLGKTIQTLAFISALKVRSKLSGVPRVSTDTGVSRGSPGLYRYRGIPGFTGSLPIPGALHTAQRCRTPPVF